MIRGKIDEINAREVIYFTKGDDPAELNRAALYVMQNEQTNHLRVIHVHDAGATIPPKLADHLKTIDRLYPHLRIDFVTTSYSLPTNTEPDAPRPEVSESSGFSLHAGIAAKASQRDKVERLVRCVLRIGSRFANGWF
jgi:hypothetical protein